VKQVGPGTTAEGAGGGVRANSGTSRAGSIALSALSLFHVKQACSDGLGSRQCRQTVDAQQPPRHEVSDLNRVIARALGDEAIADCLQAASGLFRYARNDGTRSLSGARWPDMDLSGQSLQAADLG